MSPFPRLADCTFIGSGVDGYYIHSTIDNCHFIACGATNSVIGSQAGTCFSVTRCTVTNLVNNILNPGGNVEFDSCARLIESTETQAGLYVGELVSVEAYPYNVSGTYYCTNHSVAIYQNTLSGDGAESFLDNGSGVLVQGGSNIVVADNDFSNVTTGVADWNPGDAITTESFQMIAGNSLHNVYTGIGMAINQNSNISGPAPFFLGNSYVGNIIDCIKAGPTHWAPQGSVGIAIAPEVNDTTPPSVTTNIFYNDIVVGAKTGFSWAANHVVANGPAILWECFLASDGSSSSQLIDLVDPSDEPLIQDNSQQGFWH